MDAIKKEHRRRHDHTDMVDRCACGAFLPKREKVVCANCGKAVLNYQGARGEA